MEHVTCNKEYARCEVLGSRGWGARGFTLLEMVVVVAMLAVLALIVFFSFRNYDTERSVEAAANEIVSLLGDARGKTLAGIDDSVYGVRFDIGSVTLFKGAVYDADDPANEEVVLEDVLISNMAFGGGSEVVFERLTGATDDSGTATVLSLTDASQTATITVTPTGFAEYSVE